MKFPSFYAMLFQDLTDNKHSVSSSTVKRYGPQLKNCYSHSSNSTINNNTGVIHCVSLEV